MMVAIDVNHSFHKSFFVFKKNYADADLSTEKGKAQMMRKATIDLMASINKLWVKPENVLFCFDSKSWRKTLSQDYKVHRKEKEDGFHDIINELYEILLQKNFLALKAEGAESDDLIAFFSILRNGDNFIISGDEDMHQLISEKTSVWNNNLKKPIVYLKEHNERAYLNVNYSKVIVDPKMSLFTKIMLGCDGDGVSALIDKKGIGLKTIEKFYNKIGKFNIYNDSIKDLGIEVEKNFNYFRPDFEEKFLLNRKLVVLGITEIPDHVTGNIIQEFNINFKKQPNLNYTMEEVLKDTKFFQRFS